MTKVKFLQDYRGVLTGEAFYKDGDEAMINASDARQLADRGIVTLVTLTKSVRPKKTAVKKSRAKKG